MMNKNEKINHDINGKFEISLQEFFLFLFFGKYWTYGITIEMSFRCVTSIQIYRVSCVFFFVT